MQIEALNYRDINGISEQAKWITKEANATASTTDAKWTKHELKPVGVYGHISIHH